MIIAYNCVGDFKRIFILVSLNITHVDQLGEKVVAIEIDFLHLERALSNKRISLYTRVTYKYQVQRKFLSFFL